MKGSQLLTVLFFSILTALQVVRCETADPNYFDLEASQLYMVQTKISELKTYVGKYLPLFVKRKSRQNLQLVLSYT